MIRSVYFRFKVCIIILAAITMVHDIISGVFVSAQGCDAVTAGGLSLVELEDDDPVPYAESTEGSDAKSVRVIYGLPSSPYNLTGKHLYSFVEENNFKAYNLYYDYFLGPSSKIRPMFVTDYFLCDNSYGDDVYLDYDYYMSDDGECSVVDSSWMYMEPLGTVSSSWIRPAGIKIDGSCVSVLEGKFIVVRDEEGNVEEEVSTAWEEPEEGTEYKYYRYADPIPSGSYEQGVEIEYIYADDDYTRFPGGGYCESSDSNDTCDSTDQDDPDNSITGSFVWHIIELPDFDVIDLAGGEVDSGVEPFEAHTCGDGMLCVDNSPISPYPCPVTNNPISILTQCKVERVTDASISFPHGMQFDLTRTYASNVLIPDGGVNESFRLGYDTTSTGSDRSHWVMSSFGSKITKVIWEDGGISDATLRAAVVPTDYEEGYLCSNLEDSSGQPGWVVLTGGKVYCYLYDFSGVEPEDIQASRHVLSYLSEDGTYFYFGWDGDAAMSSVTPDDEGEDLALFNALYLDRGLENWQGNGVLYNKFTSQAYDTDDESLAGALNYTQNLNPTTSETGVEAIYVVQNMPGDYKEETNPFLAGNIPYIVRQDGEELFDHDGNVASNDGSDELGATIWPWDLEDIPYAYERDEDDCDTSNAVFMAALQEAWDEPNYVDYESRYGSVYFVVLQPSGRALYYNEDGDLIRVDQNYHNNGDDVPDYVDLYYDVSGNLDSAVAPDSVSGISLDFEYTGSVLTAVDMILTSEDDNGDEVSNVTRLVEYEYYGSDDGAQEGKLKAAYNESFNDELYGDSYQYGQVTVNSDDNILDYADPASGKDAKLCRIRSVAGSQTVDLTSYIYDYDRTSEPYPAYEEWLYDPTVQNWRKLNTISPSPSTLSSTVTYGMGELPDGSGRYDEDELDATGEDPPSKTYYFDDNGQVLSIETSGLNMESPRSRTNYNEGTRCIESKEVLVDVTDDEESWVTVEQYQYVDDDVTCDSPRIETVIKTLDYDESTLEVSEQRNTNYTYDEVWPLKPATVTNGDGSRVEVDYDDFGREDTIRRYQMNHTTVTYDLMETTVYHYIESGDFTGMTDSVVSTPVAGPVRTANITYYDETDIDAGAFMGKVATVVSNAGQVDETSTAYKYDQWGHHTEVISSRDGQDETAQYAYYTSEAGDFMPQRLYTSTNYAGDDDESVTSYTYDSFGNICTVTNPLSQTTTYTYDERGRLTQTVTPDAEANGDEAVTEMQYDVFGNLLVLTDPEETNTLYTYDALGRQRTEAVYGADPENELPLYTISYGYVGVGGNGTSCSSCGGGASTIAWRKIESGDETESQQIDFEYDILGRLTLQTDETTGNTVGYVYDGLHLTSVEHSGAFWGSNVGEDTGAVALEYEYEGAYEQFTKEIHPNGRTTEYAYDSIGRLASVKDPFGFITELSYDSATGRLETAGHSTLGEASLDYDDYGVLQSLTLGNGAYTGYGYNSHDRLTSFDIRAYDATQLVKHEWDYDILGRKAAEAGLTITSGLTDWTPTAYGFDYDAASRVTNEHLDDASGSLFDVDYGFDAAGNRIMLDDGDILASLGYDAGNRETAVEVDDVAQDALTYDYKGNVTRRPPLDGSAARVYTWDAYDRMVTATVEGQTLTADYVYDAMGRLSLITNPYSAFPYNGKTAIYWLGLNRLATECFDDEADADYSVERPAELGGSSPKANGWCIFDSEGEATMAFETDDHRGSVLRLKDEGGSSCSGKFMVGNNNTDTANTSVDYCICDHWEIADRGVIGLWIKNNASNDIFKITAIAEDFQGTELQVTWTSDGEAAPAGYETCWRASLPLELNDGQWHYVELDVKSELRRQRGTSISVGSYNVDIDFRYINGLVIQAADCSVDDIVLSAGRLDRDYAMIPGMSLGSVLGAQTGADGAYDVDDGETCVDPWGVYYYQYNDLGTVLATIDADGEVLGLYQPDFYGNYSTSAKCGARPDTRGLTGQFYDEWVGGYLFRYRVLDSERGKWNSCDPLNDDGPNLYMYVRNMPVFGYDDEGMKTTLEVNTRWSKKDCIKHWFQWAMDYTQTYYGKHYPTLYSNGNSLLDYFGYKPAHCLGWCLVAKNCKLGATPMLVGGYGWEVYEKYFSYDEEASAKRRGQDYCQETRTDYVANIIGYVYGRLTAGNTRDCIDKCFKDESLTWFVLARRFNKHPLSAQPKIFQCR